MEAQTIISMSDGAEYPVPHTTEELLEILAHTRRLGEFPGFELTCDCGIVWINPDHVVSVKCAVLEEEPAQQAHGWLGRG
jgi:hypothetical protein